MLGDLFGKKEKLNKGSVSEGILHEMLRTAAEVGTDPLADMLDVLSDAIGETCELTIVSVSSREILLSTDEETESVKRVTDSIRDLGRRCYFLRHERSNVIFRRGIESVYIIPLLYRGTHSHTLVIELEKHTSHMPDRSYFDLLSLFVSMQVVEGAKNLQGQVETSSRIEGRDLCLTDGKAMSEDCHVGVVSLAKDVLFSKPGQGHLFDEYHWKVAAIIKDSWKDKYYCVGSGSFAMLFGAELSDYDCTTKVQDVLDVCIDKGILEVRGGVARISSDIHTALYFAEKGCQIASDGAVAYVRSRNGICVEHDFFASQEEVIDHFKDFSNEDVEDITFRAVDVPEMEEQADSKHGQEYVRSIRNDEEGDDF